eukprot:693278-Pleurochrysis_carterae.AAC.1
MSFGGAFAPNRFERISTLVAAWVRRKHSAFDTAQPPPTGGPQMDATPSGATTRGGPAAGRATRGAQIRPGLHRRLLGRLARRH